MRMIGVDPGLSGAMVCLDNGVPIEWETMPVMKVGHQTRVNGAAVYAFIAASRCEHVFIEQVHAMPKQGVSSMFTFGHAAGVVEGVVAAMSLPYTLVTPQHWKKLAGLIGQDKDAARSRAIQLWPQWKELHKKIKGQAYADAALIARYGL